MKKLIPLLLACSLLVGCGEKLSFTKPQETDDPDAFAAEYPEEETDVPPILINHMTEKEMAAVTVQPLTLMQDAGDYRSKWVYDPDALSAIADGVAEISIYDEELDTRFLAHVVLPPNYNPEKQYPVMLLTDGAWTLGETPAIRAQMDEKKMAKVILVTLGYDYSMDSTDSALRMDHMITKREQLLDFVTDNLMPYLAEQFSVELQNATLYGHGEGGVFVHYALFRSDCYENQPFHNYILASPEFWKMDESGRAEYMADYDFWTRKEKMDKRVFLCDGAPVDAESPEKGTPSTLTEVNALRKRFGAKWVPYSWEQYESEDDSYVATVLQRMSERYYPYI